MKVGLSESGWRVDGDLGLRMRRRALEGAGLMSGSLDNRHLDNRLMDYSCVRVMLVWWGA